MQKVCVQIEIDEQGAVSVGIVPPEMKMKDGYRNMEPVASVDEALSKAKELLGGETKSMDSMKPMMKPMDGMQSMKKGFNRAGRM